MRLVGKYAVVGWGSAFVLAAVASCTYDFDRLVAQPGSGATGGGGGSAGASGGASGSGGTAGADDGGDSDGSGGAGTAGTAGKAGSSGSGGSSGGTADAGKDAGGKAGTTDASSDRGPDAIADVRAEQAFDCTAVGGMVYQAHCYYPSTAKTTWDVANTMGCAAPSHLVVITTAGEQSVVATILAGGDRWIGLKKDLQPNMESSFHWVTGEALSFKTWDTYDTGAPEPNYTGDCVRMSASNNWGDRPCTETYPAVCERE
jgi:hypothetical protein